MPPGYQPALSEQPLNDSQIVCFGAGQYGTFLTPPGRLQSVVFRWACGGIRCDFGASYSQAGFGCSDQQALSLTVFVTSDDGAFVLPALQPPFNSSSNDPTVFATASNSNAFYSQLDVTVDASSLTLRNRDARRWPVGQRWRVYAGPDLFNAAGTAGTTGCSCVGVFYQMNTGTLRSVGGGGCGRLLR